MEERDTIEVISSMDSGDNANDAASDTESTEETTLESEPSETEGENNSDNSGESEKDETKEASQAEDSNESDDEESEEDDEESEETREGKPKKKSGFKKRIERFQRRLSEKDQEIEFLRRQMDKGGKTETPNPNEKQDTIHAQHENDKPKEEDFETLAEYTEALTDWKVDKALAARDAKARETETKSAYQKQVESFQSKCREFSQTQSDFADVLEDVGDINVSVGLEQAIITSDIGPELIYELAQDRKEYERINNLSPIAAAKEIGRIEQRLANRKESSSQKTQTRTTKAPAPPNPVGTQSRQTTSKKLTDPNLSQAEFEKIYAQTFG